MDGPVGEVPEAIVSDPRVRIGRADRPLGIAVSRNLCLARARGIYIASLDADDWYLPGGLDRLLEALKAGPEAGFAFGRALTFNLEARLEEKPAPPFTPGLLPVGSLYRAWSPSLASSRPPYVCAATLWRKELLLRLGGWTALPVHEDIALVMRADALSPSLYLGEEVYVARRHPGQSTRDAPLLTRRAEEQAYIHAMVSALRATEGSDGREDSPLTGS